MDFKAPIVFAPMVGLLRSRDIWMARGCPAEDQLRKVADEEALAVPISFSSRNQGIVSCGRILQHLGKSRPGCKVRMEAEELSRWKWETVSVGTEDR